MRIAPINIFNNNQPRAGFKNNQYDYSLNKLLIQPPRLDTVHFTRNSVMTGKEFKNLSHYMTDLYTGGRMLSNATLKKMKKRKFFSGSIKEVVYKLQPYKKRYLENHELEVFERIEKAAVETPDINLSQLFNSWYQTTRSNFRKKQKPYFDTIKTLGAQLPQKYIQPFFEFMGKIDRKLYDTPIKQDFSLKEFIYKINSTTNKVSNKNFKNRIQKLLDMLSDENFKNKDKKLSSELVKEVFDFKNIKVPGKKSAYYDKYLKHFEYSKKEVLIKIIETMQKTATENGHNKMAKLCSDNIDMLNGIPVRIPFSNKAFLYDLEELLQNMPDEKLKNQMIALAKKLPSSSDSADALILKFKDADPEVIGDRLFNPSLVSIEHMKAQSKGGENSMQNCALAKRWVNTLRGNEDLWKFLPLFPIKNQYKYAANIVKLNHRGKIKYEDALGHLKTLEKEGRIDLSEYKAKLKVVENPLITMLKAKFNKQI